ncbi:diguanylate cyclase (GGDEF)-like protein [Actimicrobium sp. GrIS 1.19]|nr:diguanylate cyclase (GGDEF)-like protein [Actimicrobium sp. GrIS 1.19]
MHIDPVTLLFSLSLLCFLMAVMSYSSARATPNKKFGLEKWGAAMGCIGFGFLLLFFREKLPWVVSFLLANGLIMGMPVLCLHAFSELFATTVSRKTSAFIWLLGMSGVLSTYFFDTPKQFAICSISWAITLILAKVYAVIQRNRRFCATSMLALVKLVIGGMALALLLRGAISLFGDGAMVAPTARSLPPIGALFMFGLFVIVSSMGFFYMVHERQRFEELESARRDDLTGLLTRKAFFEMALGIDLLVPAEAYAVVMIDIDRFKSINDAFGHSGGDKILAHAARMMVNLIRIKDLAGRYGGDEFCILLRESSEADAAILAHRMVNEAMQQMVRVRDDQNSGFTLTAGYAARCVGLDRCGGAESINAVLERADQALYLAKRAGRNQAIAALPAREIAALMGK